MPELPLESGHRWQGFMRFRTPILTRFTSLIAKVEFFAGTARDNDGFMKLDDKLFDEILLRAQESPRRRMNFDLRTQAMEIPGQAGHDVDETGSKGWRDQSQRMLNVLMADTVIPIHRHNDTSETVVVCRGRVREEFYDAEGNKTAEFVLEAGGDCPAVQVPMGQYHTLVCLEDGSVIFEAKDRAYDPEQTEDFLKK